MRLRMGGIFWTRNRMSGPCVFGYAATEGTDTSEPVVGGRKGVDNSSTRQRGMGDARSKRRFKEGARAREQGEGSRQLDWRSPYFCGPCYCWSQRPLCALFVDHTFVYAYIKLHRQKS